MNMHFYIIIEQLYIFKTVDCISRSQFFFFLQSLINSAGLEALQRLVDKAQEALDNGNGTEATMIWDQMEDVVENVS